MKYPLRPTRRRDGERRPSDAIVDCMAKHAARSLGNDVGEAVKRYFSRNSAVLSANLHGIDCLPEMVQAVWFFGLNRLAGGTPGAVIPVLSCGGVSLQSSAYPRGLQSSTRTPRHGSRCSGVPGRIPWN